MKNVKKILVISCFLFLVFSECFGEKIKKVERKEKVIEFPENYQRIFGKIEFNTELIVNFDRMDLKKGYAIPKKIELKKEETQKAVQNDFFEFSTDSEVVGKFDGYLQNELSRESLEKIKNTQPQALDEVYTFLKEIDLSDVIIEKAIEDVSTERTEMFVGAQQFQGIPVINSLYYNYAEVGGNPIRALVSDNHVEKLQVLYCYEFQKSEEDISLLSFEQIAEAVGKEFEQILTDNCYKAVEAKFIFLVEIDMEKEKYNMIPTWLLKIQEYNSNGLIQSFYEAVNAETGTVLEVEE